MQPRASGEAGLYLHLPFCSRKCGYCDFYSTTATEAQRDRYGRALLRELGRRLGQQDCRDTLFSSLYLGGGTPSIMPHEFFDELFAQQGPLAGRLCDGCEVTLEMNPESADARIVRSIPGHVRLRCSLGVQSVQPCFLKVLDRRRDTDLKRVLQTLRRARPLELSLDLITQLPGQSLGQLDQDIEALLAYQPEHLSVYGLGIEEGTPLAEKVIRGDLQPLSAEEAAAHFLHVSQRLQAAGYLHYEVSNFCRPGCVSQHNSLYWRGAPWLGIGAGASSDWSGDVRTLTRPDWMSFCDRVEQGVAPEVEKETLDLEQRLLEQVFVSLRWLGGLEWKALEAVFGQERISHLREAARRLMQPTHLLSPIQATSMLAELGLRPPLPQPDFCLRPEGWLLLDEITTTLLR